MSYIRTPAAMKARLRNKIIADHPKTTRSCGISDARVCSLIEEAMRRSVCSGGILPDFPTTADIDFDETHTVFSNAAGVILARSGGLPLSVAAANSRSFVVVVWQGRHVAMTIEEAFDRAVREDDDWDCPCSVAEAAQAIVGNVMRHAHRELIEQRDYLKGD